MPTRRLLHLLLSVTAMLVGMAGWPSPASAHNSLTAATPADGATVTALPATLSMVFENAVPLDTMSVEFVDPGGVRSDLTGLAHGPGGDTEVIVPMPAAASGPGLVTIRWRLVGSDGHPITGRYILTVAPIPAAPPAAVAPVTVAAATPNPAAVDPANIDPANIDPANVDPANVDPVGTNAVDPANVDPAGTNAAALDPAGTNAASEIDDPGGAPRSVRWLLRIAAYLGMIVIGGALAASLFLWPGLWGRAGLTRAVRLALLTTAVATLAQWLLIGADITGGSMLGAWGSLGDALQTDAGKAFLFRLILLAVLGYVLLVAPADDEHRLVAGAGLALLTIATWSFGGHSKSMRWPLIGVPLDVAHFAAVATWFGGLGVVGFVALRNARPDDLRALVPRFGRLASTAVGVVVATGAAQTIRLVGSPFQLLSVTHGRLLALKFVFVAAMLWIANINRQRVGRRFTGGGPTTVRTVAMLHRAMRTELIAGLLVMAVTAAVVVSPPASAGESGDGSGQSSSATTLATTIAPPTTLAPATTVAGPCIVSQTLQLGSTGAEVECLQRALTSLGFYTGAINGTFDEATNASVRGYQGANTLLADGIVGPKTAAKLGIAATT